MKILCPPPPPSFFGVFCSLQWIKNWVQHFLIPIYILCNKLRRGGKSACEFVNCAFFSLSFFLSSSPNRHLKKKKKKKSCKCTSGSDWFKCTLDPACSARNSSASQTCCQRRKKKEKICPVLLNPVTVYTAQLGKKKGHAMPTKVYKLECASQIKIPKVLTPNVHLSFFVCFVVFFGTYDRTLLTQA